VPERQDETVQASGHQGVEPEQQRGEGIGRRAQPPVVGVQPGIEFEQCALPAAEPAGEITSHLLMPAARAVLALARGQNHPGHGHGGRTDVRIGRQIPPGGLAGTVPGQYKIKTCDRRVCAIDDGDPDRDPSASRIPAVQRADLRAVHRTAHEDQVGETVR
jgi:hypothetical protein